jgi:hypothetical protein
MLKTQEELISRTQRLWDLHHVNQDSKTVCRVDVQNPPDSTWPKVVVYFTDGTHTEPVGGLIYAILREEIKE